MYLGTYNLMSKRQIERNHVCVTNTNNNSYNERKIKIEIGAWKSSTGMS